MTKEKREWIMRSIIAIVFVSLGLVIGVVSCNTAPVDPKIRKAIYLLDESVKDYTTCSQTVLKDKIELLKKEYDLETDQIKKSEKEKELKKLIDHYNQGKWLPITTKELWEWANETPLEEKK